MFIIYTHQIFSMNYYCNITRYTAVLSNIAKGIRIIGFCIYVAFNVVTIYTYCII